MRLAEKQALLLTALLVTLVFPPLVHAVELKTKGEVIMNVNFWNNRNFSSASDPIPGNDINSYKDTLIWERVRLDFEFIANQNIKAYVQFEIGEFTWGNDIGAFDTDRVAVEIPRAMIQYNWPETNIAISAGKFELALPQSSYFTGSPIFDENITAFLASVPVSDEFQITLAYARALDMDVDTTVKKYNDEFDFVLLSLPITPKGFKITPFIVYAWLGKDCLDRALASNLKKTSDLAGMISAVGSQTGHYTSGTVHPWWTGASLETTILDPFAFYMDFSYGQIDDKDNRNDRKGWFADFAVEYKGLDWFVPSLFFAYGSGLDNKIENGDERMPYLDEDWDTGTAWTGNSPTLKSDLNAHTMGTWYLGAKLAQISFVDKLSHDFIVAYYRGTNHKDMAPYLKYANDLTTKDSVVEVDLYSNYAIYQELTAIMELGVLFPNYDKDTWSSIYPQAKDQKTAWKVVFGLKYKF